MTLPAWAEDALKESQVSQATHVPRLVAALAIAWGALENIQKHQRTLMNDSGLVMSTTYTISKAAMRRIEELDSK